MANNDRIYLAYSGELGEAFEVETKKRINWILEQAKEKDNVLDIGCSQGIVSILLAESGKKVVGLDIQPEAIEFAQNLLEEKYSNVKERVSFSCVDFMEYESDSKFDCIVITEVLEHLQNPVNFLKKALGMLEGNGKMIISVPFGVMDHPDHVSTFYLSNFYDLLNQVFLVNSINFMERWMGAIAYIKEDTKTEYIIDRNTMKDQESNFETIDRKMGLRISELYTKLCSANEKYREVSQKYTNVKLTLEEYKKKYADSCALMETCENKYRQLLIEDFKDLTTTTNIINEMKKKLQRLSTQNRELAELNEQYRVRLEKIENNIIWKSEIKVYRKLKIIGNKILKRGR